MSLFNATWKSYIHENNKTDRNKGNAKRGISPRLKIWPWKSIGFPTHLRTKYVLSLVKIHWRMLMEKNLTHWPWPLTLKINRVSDSLKDQVCTKFGQNLSKDVDSRVFTRMLRTEGSVTISLHNFVGEGITNANIIELYTQFREKQLSHSCYEILN